MKPRARAFTLTEYLMAMVVVAIIGAAVAGVAMALSTAYAHSQGFYQYMQNARISMLRIQNTARKAKLVTAATSQDAVFWTGDQNANGLINLSEVTILSYDAPAKQVKEYRVVFPASMDPMTRGALDGVVPLSTLITVPSANLLVKTNIYCQTFVLADDVMYFRLGARPLPPLSKMLTVDLTVGREDNNLQLRSACALRADATAYVGIGATGEYVLDKIPTGP